jgi:hypothetical protein
VCCSGVSHDSGVCREPCLRREMFSSGGTAWGDDRAESYVFVAGDSEGEELISPVLKRASDAYGEYRVGVTQV